MIDRTVTRLYRIGKRDRVYLQFIMESYEGMAVLSTVDAEKGIVSISSLSRWSREVESLLSALSREMEITPLSEDTP
ncbi:MAG: DUF4911 domain-containing protein [Desulfuromonadia bacterium]